MIFSSLSARTTVRGNVMVNAMRAAVNYQDGFGGGNWRKSAFSTDQQIDQMLSLNGGARSLSVHGNLIANAGRGRNKDEGYVNAWDRLPYITTLGRSGKASTEPAVNNISGNFVLGTYSPLLDVDTDDGASFYHTFDNVLAYGGYGRKGNCNAHDVRSFRNFFYWLPRATCETIDYTLQALVACLFSAGLTAAADNAPDSGGNGPDWSNNNGWFVNNTVVLSGGADPCGVLGGYASDCPTVGLGSACDFGELGTSPNNTASGPAGMVFGGNTIMVADWETVKVPARCGNDTLQQWLAKGHDPGTRVVPVQSWPVLLAAMRAKLGLPVGSGPAPSR